MTALAEALVAAQAELPTALKRDAEAIGYRRFSISLLVGPLLESEAEDFLLAAVEWANRYRTWTGNALGPVGSVEPWAEDDDAE